MPKHVFIASSTFAESDDQPLKMIKDGGLTVSVNTTKKRLNQQDLIAQAQGADAVIAGLEIYDAKVLGQLDNLRCISRCGVGVDTIDLPLAQKKGIKIYTTPNVVVQPVVELTLAMILNLLRKVTEHTISMHQHQWQRIVGNQLAGKTVGIIGLGKIGRRVAESLLHLGAHVIGYDIHPDVNWAKSCGVLLVDLNHLLGRSDIVSLHLALNAENPFLLTQQHFESMKKGSLLINVARGALLDEKALCVALQEKHLAGVGLDVFQQEPYNGPLCDFPNVILTPHVATLTQESRYAMEIEAALNIIDFFNSVNLETGLKKGKL